MKRCLLPVIIFFLFFQTVSSADDHLIIATTHKQLSDGLAITSDGKPGFLQYSGSAEIGTTLELPVAGLDILASVTIMEPEKNVETTTFIPILIEDKALARGVTLHLITPKGNIAKIEIPPKKVFISIPITFPITKETHPDFADGNNHIVVQIVPKITKKAQVNIDNTSEDGLVADIRYEGIAYLKFKDLLNRTNRRDVDGTYFIGKENDYHWSLITENMFEKYDKRTVGIMKNHRLAREFTTQWRADNLQHIDNIKLGANMIYQEDKTYLNVGNIDRTVKDRTHVELGFGDKNARLLTRFQGIEVINPSTRSFVGLKVERFGWQWQMSGVNSRVYYEGLFGNLKVQDKNDRGEIDDHFNFDFRLSTLIGQNNKRWAGNKPTFSGESSLKFLGIGSATWVEGDMNIDVGYKNTYLFYVRYNDDFARLTGRPPKPLWEDLALSFMWNRNYFKSKDPLGRLKLESVFIDVDFSRERKGGSYNRDIKMGIAAPLQLKQYDIPFELFMESGKQKKYRPGANISIRRYL